MEKGQCPQCDKKLVLPVEEHMGVFWHSQCWKKFKKEMDYHFDETGPSDEFACPSCGASGPFGCRLGCPNY